MIVNQTVKTLLKTIPLNSLLKIKTWFWKI